MGFDALALYRGLWLCVRLYRHLQNVRTYIRACLKRGRDDSLRIADGFCQAERPALCCYFVPGTMYFFDAEISRRSHGVDNSRFGQDERTVVKLKKRLLLRSGVPD